MERVNTASFEAKDLSSIVAVGSITPDVDALMNVRVDLGKTGGLLNGAAANITVVAKITRDEEEVETYDATFAKRVDADTRMSIVVDVPIVVQATEKLEIFVLSSNASDSDVDGDVIFINENMGLFDAAITSAVQKLTGLMSLFNISN